MRRYMDYLVPDDEGEDLEERRAILAAARTGELGALIVLWEMYRCRLPLVEARCRLALPWMRGGG